MMILVAACVLAIVVLAVAIGVWVRQIVADIEEMR